MSFVLVAVVLHWAWSLGVAAPSYSSPLPPCLTVPAFAPRCRHLWSLAAIPITSTLISLAVVSRVVRVLVVIGESFA
jgi:hypothetical protein